MANVGNVGQSILSIDPCVQCLSLEQIEWLRLALFAKAANLSLATPGNLALILEESACYNCMSEKQLAQVEVTKLKQVFGEGATFAELMEEAKCLQCLDPHRVLAARIYVESEYIDIQRAPT